MKTSTANVVVSFPQERIVRVHPPPSVRETAKVNKKLFADKMIEEIAGLLAGKLAVSGVDISKEEFSQNYAMTIECLRATIYASFGVRHPFQPILKQMISSLNRKKN
jgi:hypothetical protein